MATRRVICGAFLACVAVISAQAQDADSGSTPTSNSMLMHRPVASVNASWNSQAEHTACMKKCRSLDPPVDRRCSDGNEPSHS